MCVCVCVCVCVCTNMKNRKSLGDDFIFCQKIEYKTQIRPHIEYFTQALALVSRHRNWSVILKLEGIKRVTRIRKRLQLQ